MIIDHWWNNLRKSTCQCQFVHRSHEHWPARWQSRPYSMPFRARIRMAFLWMSVGDFTTVYFCAKLFVHPLTIWFWLRSLSLSDMKSFRLKIHIYCSCSLKRQEINIKSWCFEWRPRSHCQASAGSVCTLRDASQWEETVGRSEVSSNKGELMTSRWTCATELTIH